MRKLITGSGRSGSLWVARYFNIPHERVPEAQTAYDLSFSVPKVNYYWEALDKYASTTTGPEVDSRLRRSAFDLKRYGISCVSLIRNPYDTIASTMNSFSYDKDLEKEVLYDFSMLYRSNNEKLMSEAREVFVFDKLVSDDDSHIRKLSDLLGFEFNKERWLSFKGVKENATPDCKKKFIWNDVYRDIVAKNCSSILKVCK